MWEGVILYEKKFNISEIITTEKIRKMIKYHHEQDCCENVYIDFEYIDDYSRQLSKIWPFNSMRIEWIREEWIYISFINEELPTYKRYWEVLLKNKVCVFLPVRNEQNGYYSNDIKLEVLEFDGKSIIIDINDYRKDIIDID